MAACAENVRVQLSFASLTFPASFNLKYMKCWFQVELNTIETIDALIERIASKFGLPFHTGSLQFLLDGCLLPKWETSRILRDNDLLSVTCCHQPENGEHCKSSVSLVEDKEDSSNNSQLPSTSLDLLVSQATQKKKKKKRHHSITIETIEDLDEDVLLEVNCNENFRKKKRKHKKIRVDIPEQKSDDIIAPNDTGDRSQNGSVRKIAVSCAHYEKHTTETECELDEQLCEKDQFLSSKSNRSNGHEFEVAYRVEDHSANISPKLSLSTNSNDSKRTGSASENCMLDCVAVTGNGPCTSPDKFVSARCLAQPTISARHPNESSADISSVDGIVVAEMSGLVDNLVSVNEDKKTTSRKKRRTRRRKSKRPDSLSSAAMDGSNAKKANQEKPDHQNICRNSAWPLHQFAVAPLGSTPGQPGHIVFKDDSSSGLSEEETMHSCGPPNDKQKANEDIDISVDNDCRYVSTYRHDSSSCNDQSTGLSSAEVTTDSKSVCRSNSAECLRVARSPHCLFSSTIADSLPESGRGLESMLQGKRQSNDYASKKNNPFANVQVFCRQKFKKMSSVSWESDHAAEQASSVESPGDMKHQHSDAINTKKDTAPPLVVKNYEKYQQFAGLPQKGQVLAYKILQMAEDYTPHMSDFQEAAVLSFNSNTRMIHLNVLTNQSKRKAPGRFDLTVEYDDEILTNADLSDSSEIIVPWRSLCDVRLVEET